MIPSDRILRNIENEIQRMQGRDEEVAQAFEQMVLYLRSSLDTQGDLIAKIAVAFGQSFVDLEKASKKDTEARRKELKTYFQAELDSLKAQHYNALGELSTRLSTLRDGKDSDEQTIINSVLQRMPKPKEIIPETPNEIIFKINQSDIQIKKERIEGLVDALMNIAYSTFAAMPVTTSFFNGLRAKNLTIDDATAYQIGDTVHITGIAGGSGSWVNETPTGTIDGNNKTFTLSNTPVTNTLILTLDRQPQILGADYTISGNTITFVSAPDISLAGLPFNAIYEATTIPPVATNFFAETPSGLIDGINTTYTTTHALTTLIGIWANGEFLAPSEYTATGQTITLNTPLNASLNTSFTVVYTTVSSTTTVTNETPTGVIDGVNTTYTTSHTITDVVGFHINGQFINPSMYVASGTTITMNTPLDISLAGTPFNVVYSTPSSLSTYRTETPTGAINGINTVYTTTHTITTVLGLWIQGQFIHPSDYVVSGAGFTMVSALDSSLTGFVISYV